MLVVEVVLFVGACVGHIALLAYSLNRLYGHALPHKFLTCMRYSHGLLVPLGLFAFARAYHLHLPLSRDLFAGGTWEVVGSAYTAGCAVVGLGLVPLMTLRRRLRPRPAVLSGNHTTSVDVAAQLEYKPVGRSRYQLLTRLPGNQVFQVDLTERTLCLPRLPLAWNGLTILHVSDLHLSGSPDRVFFQEVMRLCRDWEPDLVALTGDIVDSDQHHRWILPVLGHLRWRIAAYAILGNHDSWFEPRQIRRRLRRLGMRVLENSWEQIEVRGEPLVVVGNEGPWFRPAPDLTAVPPGSFRLCLSHTPDNIRWAQQHDIDLMLAGHNHGGQVRFPLIGSVLVPSRYGCRYDCGVFYEPPTVLHVSRGLGGLQPVRYLCRPEVTKIVLQKVAPSETPVPLRLSDPA